VRWLSRRLRKGRTLGTDALGAGAVGGSTELYVGDPSFDDWEVVRDFEDLETARAWHQHLREAGIEAVLTSDWPLDRFNRGDIALRVQPGRWSDAEEFLSELDELDELDEG
jgi:hypothetical protein